MGLPSGETEGGGGGDKSGLDISSYHVYIKSSSIFSRRASEDRELRKSEHYGRVRKIKIKGLTRKRDVRS
jgi:hypothetical protein